MHETIPERNYPEGPWGKDGLLRRSKAGGQDDACIEPSSGGLEAERKEEGETTEDTEGTEKLRKNKAVGGALCPDCFEAVWKIGG